MSHEARTQILTDGAKALLIINGGGVVALLGVVAKLLPFSSPESKSYAAIVLFGVACLLVGLVSAVLNYYFRFWASTYWDSHELDKHKIFFWLEKASIPASFVFFVLGVFSIVGRMLVRLT